MQVKNVPQGPLPAQHVPPVQHLQPVQPGQPIQSIQLTQPTQPALPAHVAQPAQPAQPAPFAPGKFTLLCLQNFRTLICPSYLLLFSFSHICFLLFSFHI